MKYIELNDGNKIDQVGFGVFLIPNNGETYNAVRKALDIGYRHIDTAQAYFNEEEVGRAIKDSKIPRDEIFVTSKLWLQDYSGTEPERGINSSLKNLGLDYIDLYLLHQPYGDVLNAWRYLEKAKKDGKFKSIGVSNMSVNIYKKYVPQFDTLPAVNQVEMNPYFQQKELRKLMKKDRVAIEAYQPLGHGNKEMLSDPVIVRIAKDHNVLPSQVILNFLTEEGAVVLPKSTNEERIKANLDIFGFSLSEEELSELRALDRGKGSHDPEAEGVGEMLLKNYRVHE